VQSKSSGVLDDNRNDKQLSGINYRAFPGANSPYLVIATAVMLKLTLLF